MDINEAKSFLIVMGFLCFITTSISFYNFTKNKHFLRTQINHDLDAGSFQSDLDAGYFQSDLDAGPFQSDLDANYYQKEINHDLDVNYYQDDVVVSDIFIHEQLKYNN